MNNDDKVEERLQRAELDLKDDKGLTSLQLAAEGGHLEVMKRLVKAGQAVNQNNGWEKRTPLMRAAMEGHTDCVEYLLQNEAMLDSMDFDSRTAFHLAAERGHLKVIKIFIEAGQDVNTRGGWAASTPPEGAPRTPLMWAAEGGHTDCVEYLIQNGAQLDLMDFKGRAAFHLAAEGGHLEVMKRLVEAGQDVNQKDWTDRTPLMWAAGKGHTACVQYLLQNGARLDLKNRDGRTALELASQDKHHSTVELLQTAAGTPNKGKHLSVNRLFWNPTDYIRK